MDICLVNTLTCTLAYYPWLPDFLTWRDDKVNMVKYHIDKDYFVLNQWA